MKTWIIVLFTFLSQQISAQTYQPVENGSTIKFVIDNLGFGVDGTFTGLSGTILFNSNNLTASSFAVSINSATVNTGNNTRDKHLRGEEYFNVTKYATIKIISTKIAKSTTPGYFVFFGKLTIKDKTMDISFPFKVNSDQNGDRFVGEFKIKRRDFGVGGRSTVSNELLVKLNVLTKKL